MSCPAPIRERSDVRPFSATTVLPGFTTDDALQFTYSTMRHTPHRRSAPNGRLLRVIHINGDIIPVYGPPPDQEHGESKFRRRDGENPILSNLEGTGDETEGDRATKGAASDRAAAVPGKRVIGEEDDEEPNNRAVRPGRKREFK